MQNSSHATTDAEAWNFVNELIKATGIESEPSPEIIERLKIPDSIERSFLRSWQSCGVICKRIELKKGCGLSTWINKNSIRRGGNLKCVVRPMETKRSMDRILYRPIDVIKLLHISGVEWIGTDEIRDTLISEAGKLRKEIKALENERDGIADEVKARKRLLNGIPDPSKEFHDARHCVSSCYIPKGRPLSVDEIIGASGYAPDGLCGVYFLINEDEIVYVGKSVNMYNRVQSHIGNPEKKFNKVTFFSTREESSEAVESYYISLLNPKLNKKNGMGLGRIFQA